MSLKIELSAFRVEVVCELNFNFVCFLKNINFAKSALLSSFQLICLWKWIYIKNCSNSFKIKIQYDKVQAYKGEWLWIKTENVNCTAVWFITRENRGKLDFSIM